MTKNEYIKTQIKLFSELLTQNKYQFKNNQRGPETTLIETPEWLYDHKRFIDYKVQRSVKDPLPIRNILDIAHIEDGKIIIENWWYQYNAMNWRTGSSYKLELKFYITGLHILLASLKGKKHVQSDSEHYQEIVSYWSARCEEFADEEQTNDSPA